MNPPKECVTCGWNVGCGGFDLNSSTPSDAGLSLPQWLLNSPSLNLAFTASLKIPCLNGCPLFACLLLPLNRVFVPKLWSHYWQKGSNWRWNPPQKSSDFFSSLCLWCTNMQPFLFRWLVADTWRGLVEMEQWLVMLLLLWLKGVGDWNAFVIS